MAQSIFEQLKKKSAISSGKTASSEIIPFLGFDEIGAFIMMGDASAKPVPLPNYAYLLGPIRELVRHIARIQEDGLFSIDWERSSDNIYLSEHDYLMAPIREMGYLHLLPDPKKKVYFADEHEAIGLKIVPGEKNDYHASLYLGNTPVNNEELQVLTEKYVFYNGKIVEVTPLGNNHRLLPAFATHIPANTLEEFLSLFLSNAEGVTLDIEGWEIVNIEGMLQVSPCIIFEKIDADRSLYLRIAPSLPFLSPEFLIDYQPIQAAQAIESAHQILVHKLTYTDLDVLEAGLEKTLKKFKKTVAGNFVINDGVFVLEHALASAFLYEELPAMLETYQIMGAEKLKDYKITTYTPKINLNISSGINFLQGDASLEFEGEKISLGDVLAQFAKHKYVKLSDGTNVLLNQSYIARLERIFSAKKGKKDEIEISFFDLPLIEELIGEKITGKAFERSKAVFEGFNNIKGSKKRIPKVNAELRPYQRDGVKWLEYLKENNLGGCLADDMGLGKTLQTITLLSGSYPAEQLSSLIVMPRSLLFNWEAEVRRFNPELTTYTFYGPQRNLDDALKHNLIFITYGLLRTHIEEFKEKEFLYVVLDESQNIKNLESQANKAVMLLQSKHRLALSGTPIENNLAELYSLFRFLNPTMFGTFDRFNNQYLIPIQKQGNEMAMNDLRKKIYPFLLRRLKKDVLKELPPRIEQTLYVEMEADQAKLYEQRRAFYHQMIKNEVAKKGVESAQFFIFQALNELRQLASIPEAKTEGRIQSPKKEAISEYLADVIANGHKALIFANFLAAVEEVCGLLDTMGVSYVSMTGATRNRQELVERFQNDRSCQAFVMTLKTGGTGLNLTAADTVFIFDPWWNVAAENQAIDRAHRMGQHHSVTAYKLITKNTIEEKILLLQEQKKQLFERLVSADGASIKSLNEDDIDFLLG